MYNYYNSVKSDPLDGSRVLPLKLGDERWPSSEGWEKMQSIVTNSNGIKTIIHFIYNKITGEFDDFKFK